MYKKCTEHFNNKLKKFGMDGDFTTAPEISFFFGKCIAFHLSKIIKPNFSLLEIGAGTGKLAVDILQELDILNVKIKKYYILELSTYLRNVQINNIFNYKKNIFNKVEWILGFPKDFEGVMIGNELLDALPFNLVQCKDNLTYELFVSHKNNEFFFKKRYNKK